MQCGKLFVNDWNFWHMKVKVVEDLGGHLEQAKGCAREFSEFVGGEKLFTADENRLSGLPKRLSQWKVQINALPVGADQERWQQFGFYLGEQLSATFKWELRTLESLDDDDGPFVALVAGNSSYWMCPLDLSYAEMERVEGSEIVDFISWVQSESLMDSPGKLNSLYDLYLDSQNSSERTNGGGVGAKCSSLQESVIRKLPNSVIEMLSRIGGSVPYESFFWVTSRDWGSNWVRTYLSLSGESTSNMVINQERGLEDFAPKDFLIFGGDDCFGYLSICLLPEKDGYIYYSSKDVASNSEFSFSGFNFVKLASSFDEFLQKLEKSPDEI